MFVDILLGRAEACTLRIHNDPYISPLHARITGDGNNNYWIQDHGSTNGTRIHRPNVGIIRVAIHIPTPLLPGDIIWLSSKTHLPWAGNYHQRD